MRRTPAWATLALYPVLAVVLGASTSESLFASADLPGPVLQFLVEYRWAILATPAVLLTIFFLGHVLLNPRRPGVQRYLWAAGILLLGPLVVPAYWWQCSDAI
jgi:hypothetical protein